MMLLSFPNGVMSEWMGREISAEEIWQMSSLFFILFFFFFEGPETTVSVLHIFASLMEFACCDCTAKSVVES